jgi:phospholipid-binding lipoprotein MlaA
MSKLRVLIYWKKWKLTIVAGMVGLALAGCAATTPQQVGETPNHDQAAGTSDDAPAELIDVYDPWQGFNRGVYKFNTAFDRAVFLPVVEGYEWVMPVYLQDRVTDFFANLKDLTTFANQVLQLKPAEAGLTAFRVGVNSLMGLFGLFDLATELGMPRYHEDFGQTLGHWGVGDGPYLVLPILGPSNLRDAAGWATDTAAFALVDPFQASSFQMEYPPVFALNVINQRKIQSFRYFETGSPFEYELIRFLYTQKREIEIEN